MYEYYIYIYIYVCVCVCICLYVSSHYLLVFGDARVMCYMGADDVVGGSSEA